MRGKRKNREESAPVPIVHPRAVYDLHQARQALNLAPSTLSTEIRHGRLRVARRAGKYLFLGKWLLEWIEAGELSSRKRAGAVEGANGQLYPPAREGV